jgi:hypothetical protein
MGSHQYYAEKDFNRALGAPGNATHRRNGVMPKERIEKANSFNFVWKLGEDGNSKGRQREMKQRDNFYTESLWESNYKDLVKYKEQFGNCHVSLTLQHSIRQMGIPAPTDSAGTRCAARKPSNEAR